MMRIIFYLLFFLFINGLFAQEWNQLSNVPMNARNNPVSFTIGDSAYVGTGYDGSTLYDDFWVYDKRNDTFLLRSNLPLSIENGVGFSIGSKGFAGLGWDLNTSSSIDSIYEFDPATNTWTPITIYPGVGGRGAFGTSVGAFGYVGGGGVGSTSNFQDDFWEYDPSTNSWTQKTSLPFGDRTGGVAVGLDGYVYLGLGHDGSNDFNDFWRYDTSLNSWSQMSSFPGSGRLQPEGFVLSGKVIVGGGHRLGVGTPLNDFYEYDPATDSWSQICGIPSGGRSNYTAFSILDTAYVTLGRLSSGIVSDLWQLLLKPTSTTKTTFCQGSNLQIDAFETGGTYLWNDSTTKSYIRVNTSGKYWVETTVNNCSKVDTFVVQQIPRPTVDLGADTTLCAGETLTLDATYSGATYQWQDNSTDSTFTVNKGGTYYVVVNLDGCVASDLIRVNYKSRPVVDLGSDTTLCQGDSLYLDVTTANATYLWQDNSTDSIFAVGQSGQYWVEVTTKGCSSSDTINVDFKPIFVDLGNDTTLCSGDSLILDVTNSGATYEWHDNSTDSVFKVTQAGTYFVEVSLNGCVGTDTILVNYQAYPTIDLGADTTLCQGDSLYLDATTANSTYLWQDNSTDSTFAIGQAGQYWVEVTTNGCSSRDTIEVNYNPTLIVDLGNDTTLCKSDLLTLDATISGATYQWQDNSTDSIFTVNQAGTYYVAVDLNGCVATDTILVNYQSYPTIDLGADTTLCQGDS
ncbi:MAG: kelch repeat-containing protein, partial [Vicingaceae bacterium]